MLSSRSIAQRLPDIPRWVEARDLLLGNTGEIFGLQEQPQLALVIRDPETGLIVVVGKPVHTAIRAAMQNADSGTVITAQEHAIWVAKALPGWIRSRCILHLLSYPERLPLASPGNVGFLDPKVLSQLKISEELRGQLQNGAKYSRIAASFVDQQPVSFCYAGSETETLWDVAIDTVPEHRRRGHAALCAAYMIRHMRAQGKQPVWAAVEENSASWRLAQKIGFAPVDELALFEPPRPAEKGGRLS